jgi:hypothetical protein
VAPGINQNTVALQIEAVRPEVPLLYPVDKTLLGLIKKKAKGLQTVSSRAYRAPVEITAGGAINQFNPDGGNLGRGSAIKTDVMLINQFYYNFAVEYTALAEIATDDKEKAVENYVTRQMTRMMEQFNSGIEAILAYGDSSGTLDTVVSVAGQVLTVNNANQAFDNQIIQVFNGTTNALRGSFQVLTQDPIANTLTADPTTPLPAGIVAGDFLSINGCVGPAVASSSLNGINTLQVQSAVGNYLGIQRAAYPGRLSTPFIAGNNSAITPQRARAMINLVRTAMGIDTPDASKFIWHMNVDQEAQIENIGLIVSTVIQNQLKGDASQDMLKKMPPKTFGGRPIFANIHAQPGRIDGLPLEHWFRAEIQPLDFYEVNGQTLFPIYGDDGGLASSFITYLWWGWNMASENLRAGVYSTGNAIPTGYFGH